MSNGWLRPTPLWDILGLGCTAVDDLLYLETFPAPEVKAPVQRRERQCGGQCANALVAAARLGTRCAFGGVLGDDEDSRFVLETFRRESVDTGPMVYRPGARPIHSTVLVDQSRNTRTVLYDLTGSIGAAEDAPDAEVIRSARVLLIDHFGVEGMTRAARIAREAGIPVVADFECHDWPGFLDLLGLADHLIVSYGFAQRLKAAGTPAEGVARLWAKGRSMVIVTDGEHGCWYRAAGSPEVIHQQAFTAEVHDTTGCGDVFRGAYAAGLVWGLRVADRIPFAAAAAAIKARHPGAQSGIPTRQVVETFLRAERD
jgi:sulfofructose kinase